jgi:Zn finger protein HypA/HybF involved in hydrogenase expression
MHEHSVADAIVKAVEARRQAAGARLVRRAVLQISELSALSPQSLQMMIDHAAEELGVPSFAVEVLRDGLLGHCPNCGLAPISDELVCRRCGQQDLTPAGDEGILLVSCEFA